MDRTLNDEGILGIGFRDPGSSDGGGRGAMKSVLLVESPKHVKELREDFVRSCLNCIDVRFGRRLGCRMSDKLCSYLNPENHIMGMTRNKKKRMASNAKNALLQQASPLPEAASATPV